MLCLAAEAPAQSGRYEADECESRTRPGPPLDNSRDCARAGDDGRPRAVNRAGPDPSAGTGSAGVRLRPVHGDADYAKFPNSLPWEASYCPIGGLARERDVEIRGRLRKGAGVGRRVVSPALGSATSGYSETKTSRRPNPAQREDAVQGHPSGDGALAAHGRDRHDGRPDGLAQPLADDGAEPPWRRPCPVQQLRQGVLWWESERAGACAVEAQRIVCSDLFSFTTHNQRRMMGERWLPEGELLLLKKSPTAAVLEHA
jgi:hypothetical protein